jgi:hypothetical protein
MPDERRRADSRIRTDDLIITNDLLYQLSYIGILVLSEWDHILAIAASLCFREATVKKCFGILNVAIRNHSGRRTKAERDLIQGGFAPRVRRDRFSREAKGREDGRTHLLRPTETAHCHQVDVYGRHGVGRLLGLLLIRLCQH